MRPLCYPYTTRLSTMALNKMMFSITMLSITILRITKLSILILGIMILSITILGMMILSITLLCTIEKSYAGSSISAYSSECHYVECCYANLVVP